MSTPLVKVFSIGAGVPEIQIFSSASRSKWPAVSTAVGEEDGVAYQQVRRVHLLVLAEQPRVVVLGLRRIDGVRVSEQRHDVPPLDVWNRPCGTGRVDRMCGPDLVVTRSSHCRAIGASIHLWRVVGGSGSSRVWTGQSDP